MSAIRTSFFGGLEKRVALLASAVLVLMGVSALASVERFLVRSVLPDASVPAAVGGSKAAKNGIYIVTFDTPSIVRYEGGTHDLAATDARAQNRTKFDPKSPAVKAYNGYLSEQRSAFEAAATRTLSRSIRIVFDYRFARNAVAIRANPSDAKIIANLPGVVSVKPDIQLLLATDSGPAFIGSPAVWDGTSAPAGIGTLGEGTVIGVIDSGVNSDHPSFAEIDGDGYVHINPLGSGNYTGRCALPTTDPLFFGGCNNKLIGAHDFIDAVAPSGAENDGPEDENGHGSHTTSTAAGNFVDTMFNARTATLNLPISGVAPHANVIVCDACYSAGGRGICLESALLACVDQLIIDGVDVINYSIGGGEDPWLDSVSLGFLNATAAGIYIAASAGNAGPDPVTLSHQEPWVSTTAASTHDSGGRANSLIDLSSDQGSLPDMIGLGITAGYGPAIVRHASEFPNPNDPDGDPGQCLQRYPTGTFSGEIIVCDRGQIARLQKGVNVMLGGAGGFVLANTAAEGEWVVADDHYLPAVHVGFTDGEALRNWLANNTNTVAVISGMQPIVNPNLGDVVASFSSRGPNSSNNVIKPDLTAPGVSIYAAVQNNGTTPPELGTRSGTSMSSPHNAGAGALLKALFPSWSPYEIKSALMMTAVTDGVLKEDFVTPSDPFDRGAGRIDLNKAALTGLVMDETPANFQNANPDIGGDPKTLNLPSLQDANCISSCSWTRTFRSVSPNTTTWDVSSSGSSGLQISIVPSGFSIAPGATQTVTIDVLTVTGVDNAWNFDEIVLTETSSLHPELSLPLAVFAKNSTNPALLTKTVSLSQASDGDTVTYSINLNNMSEGQTFTVTDELPAGATFVTGSENQTIVGGATASEWSYDSGTNSLTWTGTLGGMPLVIEPSTTPFGGYMSLGDLGVTPSPCNFGCDDGALVVSGFDITYFDQRYTDGLWSVNGTLGLGANNAISAVGGNSELPSVAPPNNFLAVFWTDLDLSQGGNWYQADVTIGPATYRVFSWENVPRFNEPETYSFQIWFENGTSNIWYVYDELPVIPPFLTIGFENADATFGYNYYYNGSGAPPQVGTDLIIRTDGGSGGNATFEFDAVLTGASDEIIENNVEAMGTLTSGTAFAGTIISAAIPTDFDGDGVVDSVDNCTNIANADQRDTNGDGHGNVCDFDFTNDCLTNFLDFFGFSNAFGASSGDANFNDDVDLDGNGVINFLDFGTPPNNFTAFFGSPPGPSASACVPAP